MTLIEVANGTFIHLLRYLETSFDILCFALIAKITYSGGYLSDIEAGSQQSLLHAVVLWVEEYNQSYHHGEQ